MSTEKYDVSSKVTGKVELFMGDVCVAEFHNDVLYSGADILAKVLSGDTSHIVNGVYIEYYNGTPVEPTVSRSRANSYYEGLSAPAGYIRVATVSEPTFSTSGSDYSNNRVQFIGQTSVSVENGPGLIDGTSQFYGVALVAMPDFSDKTQDVIFSAANVEASGSFAPITKVANADFSVKWTIQFD